MQDAVLTQALVSNTNGINVASASYSPNSKYTGMIEVVVLRSLELQRPKAPNPSVSELHPLAFQQPYSTDTLSSGGTGSSHPPEDDDMSDFDGIFDGASDSRKNHTALMPFGGDMTWDDDDGQNGRLQSSNKWAEDSSRKRGASNHAGSRSRAPSRSSSHTPANPAVQIIFNQPPVGAPTPGFPDEPPPWRRPTGSQADSWASRAPAHRNRTGHDQDAQSDNGWQTWIKGVEKQGPGHPRSDRDRPRSGNHQNSPQQSSSSSGGSKKTKNNSSGWGKTVDPSTGVQAQNMPGAWGADTKGKNDWSNNNEWNDHGEASSNRHTAQRDRPGNVDWNDNTPQASRGQKTAGDWDNNGTNANQPDTGWSSGNNQSNNQGNWDSTRQNSKPSDDWGGGTGGGEDYDNNGGNGNWDSGQNYDTNQADQDEGDWNGDHGNGQGNNEWGGTGGGEGANHQYGNNYNNNQAGFGNAWDNATTGAKEPQASSSNLNWNTFSSNQNHGYQDPAVNDAIPVTTGALDPDKRRNRRVSSGKGKTVKANLSQQASMNHAAQKMGWKPSNSIGGNGAGFARSEQQQPGHPGAWPEDRKNAPNTGSKPYHAVLNAVGNPTLPAMPPIPPIVEAPASAPPHAPAEMSHAIHRGNPALYQHKTASPRYMDTHDKPYASFVFKYRPKG